MKLIYDKTGEPVAKGDKVELRDGEQVFVTGWTEPHKPGSTGRIHVAEKMDAPDFSHALYFPSVFGASWKA